MVLDVTHLADKTFWQAIEHSKLPVLASHNNCRALAPGQRGFPVYTSAMVLFANTAGFLTGEWRDSTGAAYIYELLGILLLSDDFGYNVLGLGEI